MLAEVTAGKADLMSVIPVAPCSVIVCIPSSTAPTMGLRSRWTWKCNLKLGKTVTIKILPRQLSLFYQFPVRCLTGLSLGVVWSKLPPFFPLAWKQRTRSCVCSWHYILSPMSYWKDTQKKRIKREDGYRTFPGKSICDVKNTHPVLHTAHLWDSFFSKT